MIGLPDRSQSHRHRELAPERQPRRHGNARPEPERAELSHVLGRRPDADRAAAVQHSQHTDPRSGRATIRREIHNESYFGQATLDLYNQLYFTGALRDDGSTTFGRRTGRSLFPKASAAWTFTNAYKPQFLTFGKARLSYGEAGQEPQPYLTSADVQRIEPRRRHRAGHRLHADAERVRRIVHELHQAGERRCKPERTKELEGGIDVGFWGEKADFSATWYHSKTSDVILVLPTAPSSGYSSEAKNGGVFSNSGTELSLNLRPITRANYAWDIGIGWGRNTSNVDTLSGAQFLLTDNVLVKTVAQQGYPLGVIRSLGWVRCGISAEHAIDGVDLRRRAPARRRARCTSTMARTTDAATQGHAVPRSDRAHHRQSEPALDGQRAHELPLSEVGVLRAARHQEGRRRLERHARARCSATARIRTPRFARRAPARRRRAARAMCTRSARQDFYPGPVTVQAPASVPGR